MAIRNQEADHPHSDPSNDAVDVAEAIDHYRPEWADGVVGFSPNVDGVDAAPSPGLNEGPETILPNVDSEGAVEEIAFCIRQHTAARGVDLWAVDVVGLSAAKWAEMTGRNRSTVARNVRRAQGGTE